jgi:hypothetical protein
MQMKKRKRKIRRIKTRRKVAVLRSTRTLRYVRDAETLGNYIDKSLNPRIEHLAEQILNLDERMQQRDHVGLQISAAIDKLNRLDGMITGLNERLRQVEGMDLHPAVIARRLIALQQRVDSGERAREAPSRLDQHEIRSLRVDLNKVIERSTRVPDMTELAEIAKGVARHDPERTRQSG